MHSSAQPRFGGAALFRARWRPNGFSCRPLVLTLGSNQKMESLVERPSSTAPGSSGPGVACLFLWVLAVAGLTACSSAPGRTHGGVDGGKKLALERVEPALTSEEAAEEERVRALTEFAAGIHHEIHGDPQKALEAYAASAASDPAHEELVAEVAQRYLRDKKPAKALELLKPSAAMPGATTVVLSLLSSAQRELGQHAQAVRTGRLALQRGPDNLFAIRSLYLALAADRRLPEAIALVETKAKLQNLNLAGLMGLGEAVLHYSGQKGADTNKVRRLSAGILDRAAKLAEPNPAEFQRVAELSEGFRDYGRAERIYLQLLDRFPGLPALRSKLTGIYLRNGDRKGAVAQLEALAKANPTNPNVHFLLGALALEAREWDAAEESLERALKLKPDLVEAYFDLANLAMNRRQPERVDGLMERAFTNGARRFPVQFYRALAASRMKKFDEALRNLTEAEVVAKVSEPERLNHLFYFELGSVHERRGDFPSAVKALRRSIELSPNFAEALNYLGYMWAERGENLVEAHDFIARALKEEPRNPAFLDSMAWVLHQQKKSAQALDYMLKAVELNQEPDPTLFDHLGDIQAAAGQSDKAREAWKRSLELEPSEAVRKKLRPTPVGPVTP